MPVLQRGPRAGEPRGGGAECWAGLGACGAATAAPPSHASRSPHPPSPQLYEPFYADFGPLNLGKAHRFVLRTAELLQASEAPEGACRGRWDAFGGLGGVAAVATGVMTHV